MRQVRFEPVALRSGGKHSTTEPLCSHTHGITILYHLHQCRPFAQHGLFRAKVGKGGITIHVTFFMVKSTGPQSVNEKVDALVRWGPESNFMFSGLTQR